MNPLMESIDPRYREMIAAFVSDKRNWVIPAYGIRKRRIDLTVAKVQEETQIKGDYIYADYNSNGVAEIALNSPSEDAFPLIALSGVSDLPYDKVYITSDAQPGLFINLWYGYRSRFISPTSAIATIGSILNAVEVQGPRTLSGVQVLADRPVLTRDVGIIAGAQFLSNSNLAAGATQQVFAAASNTNGAIVWDCKILTNSAAANMVQLLAKATAPTAQLDGVLIHLGWQIAAAAVNAPFAMPRLKFIPAGLGLFFFNTTAETAATRQVDYTLL